MRLPNDPNKFTSQFKYVEVARYVAPIKKVVREKKDDNPLLINISEVSKFAEKFENTGIYTSVFQYNSEHFHSAASLGPLYFDLDSDDLELARSETYRLVEYLLQSIPESAIRAYFSGGKGFHVECEPITLGISSTDDLAGVFRFIARDITEKLSLTTIDFAVYDVRRMWRLPNSRHQRSGLYKTECLRLLRDSQSIDAILDNAKEPKYVEVPEQIFDFRANQWYREYTYQYEESLRPKTNSGELLARFLEQGTSYVKNFNDDNKVFDKFKLLKNCSAVRELQDKARKNHHLDHYERLFLCSLLTYNREAVEFLNEILSECSDYNFEISNAHIDVWIRRREYGIGGRPFTCEKAKQVGISCSSCDNMSPRKKIVRLSDGKFIETEEESMPSPVRHAYTMLKGDI